MSASIVANQTLLAAASKASDMGGVNNSSCDVGRINVGEELRATKAAALPSKVAAKMDWKNVRVMTIDFLLLACSKRPSKIDNDSY